MALSAKLELRQSQQLVMTPQLQQAIKLLQLSNIELGEFVEQELERNPILERRDENEAQTDTGAGGIDDGGTPEPSEIPALDQQSPGESVNDIDTDYVNIDPDAGYADLQGHESRNWSTLRTGGGGGIGNSDYNLEAYVASEPTLHEHLHTQLVTTISDPVKRLIACHLIDMVGENGYLRGDYLGLGEQIGASLDVIEDVIADLQTFDPTGVCARNLKECLALQLKEQDRFDPMMAAVIEHLELLVAHDFTALRRISGADKSELNGIIAEIKALNPKPGLKFGSTVSQPVIPDVIIKMRSDRSWLVELNSETLPKVLVDRNYLAVVSKAARNPGDKEYLNDCLSTANWLVRSLDQRARTILKVSQEIIRQQDGFLTYGVQHLRPLNLKTVADAIDMHESTVSRVTSGKYMETPRGIFELKFFFTSSIPAAGSGEAHSSEAVRDKIRQLIENESAKSVLSDDKIVTSLKDDGVDIARRTVAKYREAMHIPSSVQRRRQKKMAAMAGD